MTGPPSGAGHLLELGAEGHAAAEEGNPRDAGVVELGHVKIRRAAAALGPASLAANSASRAFHTCGPFCCPAAALASCSGPASARRAAPCRAAV